jgi:hypothetical protein
MYTGDPKVDHGDAGCPLRPSSYCNRCCCRGHLPVECTKPNPQQERPRTLEQLIAPHLRLQYKIITHTPIVYKTEITDDELSDINKLVVPETYIELGKFVKKHGISVPRASKTKPSEDDLLAAIYKWGKARGFRIVQETTMGKISLPGTEDDTYSETTVDEA